jgi:GTP-binding protein
MIIRSAQFITSSTKLSQTPDPLLPEFAFIGRSNVGKSSLINMLTANNKLAKISGSPGKTRTINHFLINGDWYIADLPGYGYAKVSKKMRAEWQNMINEYILKRENLVSLFLLIDSRHDPIESDLGFMEFLGLNSIPFARVFTKADKQTAASTERKLEAHNRLMLQSWDSLPQTFITSSEDRRGREDILGYISESMMFFTPPAKKS